MYIYVYRVLKIDVQSLMNEDPESGLLQSCKEHGSVWTYLNTTQGNKVREAGAIIRNMMIPSRFTLYP
jgi:hypothetical protein